ncbi:hypothetical protein LINGRAHAP2_LOCUS9410 [Linum grandiflorum]
MLQQRFDIILPPTIPNYLLIFAIICFTCVLGYLQMINFGRSMCQISLFMHQPLNLLKHLFKSDIHAPSFNPSPKTPSHSTSISPKISKPISTTQMDPDQYLNQAPPPVEITDDDLDINQQRNALSLLGIFLGNLPPYPLAINTLKKKEQLEGSISITGLDYGLCQFVFSSESDKEKLLKKSPCSSSRFLVCFAEWEPPTPQAVAMLIHAPYWIHIWDLPREYCTKKIGDKLGGQLGHVLTTFICEDIASHKLFIRVRVVINVARPLLTEVTASHNKIPFTASLRYENIPLLCFICGLLGHDKAHCPRKLYPSPSTSCFGPELRARRGWRQVDEVTLKPVPVQPPESFWDSFGTRFNHFEVPTEDSNQFTSYLNDPVLIYEPFFQQGQDFPVKQELQLSTVEAITFFQNSGNYLLTPLHALSFSGRILTLKPLSFRFFQGSYFKTNVCLRRHLLNRHKSNSLFYVLCNHSKGSFFRHHLAYPYLPSDISVCSFFPSADDNSSSGMFQKHRPLRISEPTPATMIPVYPSPDSVLKCPAEVLSDLNEAEDFRQNLIEEQKAIEADLAMQKLSPTVITLMKVSKSVADELKIGVDVIRPVIPEATRMESMIQSPRSPTSRKRTRESAQDPKGKKKQHSDEEMVEAASQKWLHEQK